MKLLFPLLGHLLVTLARLASPGGVRSVVAESVAVKHQLLIMKRSRRRAPNLTRMAKKLKRLKISAFQFDILGCRPLLCNQMARGVQSDGCANTNG